jgi:hypothetical protein
MIKVVLFDDSVTEDSRPLHVIENGDTTVEAYAMPTYEQIDKLIDLMLRVQHTLKMQQAQED